MKNLPAFIRDYLFMAPCALLGALGGFFLFRWSIPVAVVVALGFFCGIVIAGKVFHRVGVDVWFTPIFTALLFAVGMVWVAGSVPLTGRYVLSLGMQVMAAFVFGQIGYMFLLWVHSRITKK